MTNQKILWLDNARFLVIMTVLIAHAPIRTVPEHFVQPYAMPFFYLSAGLFLKSGVPYLDFVKAKFKRLMIPYFVIALASLVLWLGYRSYAAYGTTKTLPEVFLTVFTGIPDVDLMAYNVALWFLPSLFTTLCWTYFVLRLPKVYQWPVLLIAAAVAAWVSENFAHRLPWSSDLMFVTGLFTYVGYVFREKLISLKPLNNLHIVLLFFSYIVICIQNPGADLFANRYGNLPLLLVSSLLSISVLLSVAKKMPEKSILNYLGSKSFEIFALHVIVFHLLSVFIFHMGAPDEFMPPFDGFGLMHKAFVAYRAAVYIILGIVLPLMSYKLHRLLMAKLSRTKAQKTVSIPRITQTQE